MGSVSAPKLILYTNHACPWAHRAHIALHELGLEFEEKIIDLSVPRTPEYLQINPRGLVPSLDYNGDIITESAIVAQFLVDSHPSHLEKSSTDAGGALQRSKINYFVDTYFSKVNPPFFAALRASKEDKETESAALVDVIVKEIEPLLQDAAPFFGGASQITLAEVLTGSFLLRALSFPKYDGLLPESILGALESKAPAFWKWANAVVAEKSVNHIWDEKKVADGTQARFANLAAAAAK